MRNAPAAILFEECLGVWWGMKNESTINEQKMQKIRKAIRFNINRLIILSRTQTLTNTTTNNEGLFVN